MGAAAFPAVKMGAPSGEIKPADIFALTLENGAAPV
jgi:hypothetical protein